MHEDYGRAPVGIIRRFMPVEREINNIVAKLGAAKLPASLMDSGNAQPAHCQRSKETRGKFQHEDEGVVSGMCWVVN